MSWLSCVLPNAGWWLADLALRGSALLGATLLLMSLARHRSASQRHLIGMTGLIAMPVLPLAMACLPARFSLLPSLFIQSAAPMGAGVDARSSTIMAPWLLVILVAWATVGLVLGARAVAASWRLEKFFRQGQCLPSADESLTSSNALNLRRQPEVRTSDAVDLPITFGLLRPRVLLPSEAANWSQDRLDWVLLHEQAHIARRDPAAQALTIVVCCLFWWQPLVWRLGRRLELEREHAADDRVLAHRDDAVGYANLLVDIAEGLRGRPVTAFGLSMARPSQLSARLRAMFNSQIDHRQLGPGQASLAMIALSLPLIPLAAMPNPTIRVMPTERAFGSTPAGIGHGSGSHASGHGHLKGLASGHQSSTHRSSGHRSSGHRSSGHRGSTPAAGGGPWEGHTSGGHGAGSPREGMGHGWSGHSANGHRSRAPTTPEG